jgi:sugar O-acyltransferase (sialic acid O-acetyltransferase NeuD family)
MRVLFPDRVVIFVDDAQVGENCVTMREYLARVQSDGGESVMGSGRCEVRRQMLSEIRPPLATIIHPTAVVMGEVGPGCVVAPGAVVAPNAQIGPHVMVNYNATIGHDAVVGRLSVIGPGAAIGGWCQLEEAVYVGAGVLIRERLTVQHDAVIGMGAVVTKDVPAEMVAIGVPARFKDKAECGQGWLT